MKKWMAMPLLVGAGVMWVSAQAATHKDAEGLWLSQDQKGVVEFKSCADNAAWLCGTIVWDKEATKGKSTCGQTVAKLKRFEDEAWRDGTAHDPRTKKNYKATVRVDEEVNPKVLKLRAYIGTEALGQTEEMTKVASAPGPCIK